MTDKPQTLAEQILAMEPPLHAQWDIRTAEGFRHAQRQAAALADLTAWRDGQRPPSEYEQKLAALKKDFPNGI